MTNHEDVKICIEKLNEEFHCLKNATREQLEKKNVPVKDVTDTLTSLSPFKGETHHKLFLHDNLKQLFDARDQHEVFTVMNFHWDYLNYPLLEVVINRFDIIEVKERMKSYISNLQDFRKKTPLLLFCKVHKRKCVSTPEGFCKIVAKFDCPITEELTLQTVEEFRKAYADHYDLQTFAVFLLDVRNGSFLVTWYIPENAIGRLHVDVPEALLQKFFIKKLKVGSSVVYEFDRFKLKVKIFC